uniref:Uncharacterized protein n=1 Tax=Tanacetum cinerariifolium TaxID=118510 RepID=A0A6L2K578_TANCI|nr:hypothetical protein [Tanacetum cinerariifolium]
MVGEDDSLEWHQKKAHPKHIQWLLGAKLNGTTNGTTVLVTSSEDLTLRVWYGSSGKLCVTHTKAKNYVLAISPNGRYIAALASCEKSNITGMTWAPTLICVGSDVCSGEKEVKVACCVENDDGSGNENAD